jgi:Ca-activated chloride channel family protein
VPGTALADALRAALAAFGPTREAGRARAIVLLSDGEDHEGGLDEVLGAVARAGVVVHALGCGTTAGAPIPLRTAAGSIAEYKKDGEGRIVTSRLDEALLERVALATNGRYERATPAETEIDEIARAIGAEDGTAAGALLRTRYEERYQIPLLLGAIALAVELLLGDRRRARASRRERRAA